MDFGVLNNIS